MSDTNTTSTPSLTNNNPYITRRYIFFFYVTPYHISYVQLQRVTVITTKPKVIEIFRTAMYLFCIAVTNTIP